MLLAHPRQDFPAGQATTVLRTPAHVGVEETRVSLRLAARRPRCGTATYEALFDLGRRVPGQGVAQRPFRFLFVADGRPVRDLARFADVRAGLPRSFSA